MRPLPAADVAHNRAIIDMLGNELARRAGLSTVTAAHPADLTAEELLERGTVHASSDDGPCVLRTARFTGITAQGRTHYAVTYVVYADASEPDYIITFLILGDCFECSDARQFEDREGHDRALWELWMTRATAEPEDHSTCG